VRASWDRPPIGGTDLQIGCRQNRTDRRLGCGRDWLKSQRAPAPSNFVCRLFGPTGLSHVLRCPTLSEHMGQDEAAATPGAAAQNAEAGFDSYCRSSGSNERMAISDDEVIGRSGTVTTRIRGGELPGEVVVAVRGGTESFIAYADEEIPRGETILVFRSRGPRAIDVTPYPEAELPTDPL
jgi:hypothetical protein